MSGTLWEMNAMSLIKTGGPLMLPLLICSFFAVAITIEKLIFFGAIRTNIRKLKDDVFAHVKNNKVKEALQVCDSDRSPVSQILKAGIIKLGSSRDDIKESMEDASLYEIPRLESRLGALATIAHISPLIGLLGTVTGMTASFHTIQIRAASLNPVTPGDLAGGIGEALLTTVAGLLVAIPAFVAYNYFVNRINHVTLEMERAGAELLNFMTQITETSV